MPDPLQERREAERRPKSAPRHLLLFVVSRHTPTEYLHLKRIFADDDQVTVILDRRSGDRRGTVSTGDPERRQADRRSQPLIDDRLRRQGWVMVRL
jgi:hypothetical protein